jgi:glycosyltransferase involved in cell wall biosynthesis
MITGRDIVYISSIEWSFLWQGHQEIARRLAAAGNRVFYVENTGVRSPGLRDAGRVAQRLRRWLTAARTSGVREVAPNIFLCSPLILPPLGPRWRRAVNRRALLPAIRRATRRLGMRDPLIWTYLPTDTAADLIRILRGPRSGVVYYCVADFTQLTPQAERLREHEREVVEMSDVVYTNCSALARSFSRWNPNAHVFPFGVDLEAFRLNPNPSLNGAGRLAELPRPVVGYVGGLHRHVDFEMLERMARERPGWSWVYIGASQADVGGLGALPNVHFLGQRPHKELGGYVGQFDVCIVPYAKSAYTDTVVPTKINEYLAMGKPVVSTDIPTVLEFNEEHGVLLTAPCEPAPFLAAIEKAVSLPSDSEAVRRRREVAELADWKTRFEQMNDLFEARLRETGRHP